MLDAGFVNAIVDFLHNLMATPWFYPLVSLLIIGDALIPFVPSETILNLSGAFAASQGVPHLGGLFAATVIGGIIGDNLCFAFGARLIGVVERLDPCLLYTSPSPRD